MREGRGVGPQGAGGSVFLTWLLAYVAGVVDRVLHPLAPARASEMSGQQNPAIHMKLSCSNSAVLAYMFVCWAHKKGSNLAEWPCLANATRCLGAGGITADTCRAEGAAECQEGVGSWGCQQGVAGWAVQHCMCLWAVVAQQGCTATNELCNPCWAVVSSSS